MESNNKLINGRKAADKILDNLRSYVVELEQEHRRLPCLAVIWVGEDPASQIYVGKKKLACESIGIRSLTFNLASTTTQQELFHLIQQLNQDNSVDGILVQLPLPKHLDVKSVVDNIAPDKDVDGFHRYNMGALALNDPNLCPCTPHGVMYLLDELKFNYHGKHAVILGMSNITGRPMALELINRGTTISMCNSKTTNLLELLASADVVIAAIGRPRFVKGEWLKAGCIVIDIGINRLANGKVCGDVDFESAITKAAHITPVPGGVGPMTIAMLLQNTIYCYKLHLK